MFWRKRGGNADRSVAGAAAKILLLAEGGGGGCGAAEEVKSIKREMQLGEGTLSLLVQ